MHARISRFIQNSSNITRIRMLRIPLTRSPSLSTGAVRRQTSRWSRRRQPSTGSSSRVVTCRWSWSSSPSPLPSTAYICTVVSGGRCIRLLLLFPLRFRNVPLAPKWGVRIPPDRRCFPYCCSSTSGSREPVRYVVRWRVDPSSIDDGIHYGLYLL